MRLCFAALIVSLAVACGGGGGDPTPAVDDALSPSAASNRAPTSASARFSKTISARASQTVQGLTITLQGVRIGAPSEVFGDESAATRAEYSSAKSVIVVNFEAYN